ncbi:LANO_0F06172g1_1 [Lachancea nothofagi CBS 11611]|uniref:LANO_0F06172g1_1 n=1 Tax=Lachancea nothofagi CBS 11611 TaxID=1266666 RepID=A0A1G4K8H1_9SACH|nr:LANO_0F06172g1_1 [Lachancea nothofagi CBS 11611]
MDPTSGNSQKRAKALDVLEKHMSQQNKRSRSSNYGALSSMLQTISGSSRLPAPSKQPYREVTVVSSPTRKKDRELSVSHHISESPEPLQLRSSPLRKSVAFSDRIDSSPLNDILNSSPRPLSQARPPRPILKPSVSPVRFKSSPQRSRPGSRKYNEERLVLDASTHVRLNPLNLDYWVCGEVHSLYDTNSVAEFKAILTGGLYFMSSGTSAAKERYFEFYATFNNIMPVYTSQTYSAVKDKKIQIVISNIDLILTTCIPQLIEFQAVLLSSLKKDPFASRTYVQIIRFLNTLFSNFKLIKACDTNRLFLSSLHEVVHCCIESMQHPNSNKVMIIAQLALLREEQCGIQKMTALNVTAIIKAIPKMKKIDSSNLICEKLLLLKNFLAKYPDVMLDNINSWLPTEVFSRLLIDEEFYSSKIASNSVSILLDLLKKCLTECNNLSVLIVLKQPASDHLASFRGNEKIKKYHEIMESKVTFEELLLTRVDYLVQKEEPKLAMDLWLALVGLLFNSDTETDKLCSNPINPWLRVNLKYQAASEANIRGLALRSWRIVTYVLCCKIARDPDERSFVLVDTLFKPFAKAQSRNKADWEQICYVLRGVLYMALCNHDSKVFSFNLSHIVKPLLLGDSQVSFKGCRGYCLQIINALFPPPNSARLSKKEYNPLKVVASAGVVEEDFLLFPSQVCEKYWQQFLEYAIELIDAPESDADNNSFHFLALNVEKAPESFVSEVTKDLCLRAFSESLLLPLSDFMKKITQTLSSSMLTFKHLMWKPCESNKRMQQVISSIMQKKKFSYVDLLKAVIDETRNGISDLEVYNYFLAFNETTVVSYVSNSVSSKIHSPLLSHSAFSALLCIANKIPKKEIAENVMRVCDKLKRDVGTEEHCLMNNCDKETLSEYLKFRISPYTPEIDQEFVEQFGITVRSHTQLASHLHEILDYNDYSILVLRSMILESSANFKKSKLKLEWWEPIISEYPKNALAHVATCFGELSEHLKLCFISRAMELGDLQSIRTCRLFVENMAISCPNELVSSKIVLSKSQRGVLKDCLLKRERSLLNEALCMFAIAGFSSYIAEFWQENEPHVLGIINARTLVMLVDKAGEANESVSKYFKTSLVESSSTFIVEAIEAAMDYDKIGIIVSCKEEITEFLLGNSERLGGNRSRAMDVLPKILNIIAVEDNKALSPALRRLCCMLPAKKESLVYEQLSILCLAQNFNSEGIKKIRENIEANLFELPALKNENDLPHPKKCSRQYKFHSIPACSSNSTLKTKNLVKELASSSRKSLETSPKCQATHPIPVSTKPDRRDSDLDVQTHHFSATDKQHIKTSCSSSLVRRHDPQLEDINLDCSSSPTKNTVTEKLERLPTNAPSANVQVHLSSEKEAITDNRSDDMFDCTSQGVRGNASEPSISDDKSPNNCVTMAKKRTESESETCKISPIKEAHGSLVERSEIKSIQDVTPAPQHKDKVSCRDNILNSCGNLDTSNGLEMKDQTGLFESLVAKHNSNTYNLHDSLTQDPAGNALDERMSGLELKIPIFKSGKTKENQIYPKPAQQVCNNVIPTLAKDVQDCKINKPHANSINLLPSPCVETGAYTEVSGTDRQTRMIVKIIKQFGKSEFSQLTDTQKGYLRNAVLKFVADAEANRADQNVL